MAQQEDARKDATEVQSDEARLGFADLLNRVGFGGERIVITRYNKPVAALVPMKDFEALPTNTVAVGAE